MHGCLVDWLALLVSIGALWISWLAKRASERSADEARRSADAAERSASAGEEANRLQAEQAGQEATDRAVDEVASCFNAHGYRKDEILSVLHRLPDLMDRREVIERAYSRWKHPGIELQDLLRSLGLS